MAWSGWIQCDMETATILWVSGVKFGEQCSNLGKYFSWKDCDVTDEAYEFMLTTPNISWCLVHK